MKINRLLMLILALTLTFCDDSVRISTDLKGHWNWKSTCGGVVGCTYPSQTNNQKMIIQETLIQQFTNGDLTFSRNYSIKSTAKGDNSMTYEIEFDDDEIWIGEISNNILTIQYNSVIASNYERIR
jgi:hypothetical protein